MTIRSIVRLSFGVTAVLWSVTAMRAQNPAPAKVWTLSELLPVVNDLGSGRNWELGKEAFIKAGCNLCHSMGSDFQGTGLAPDLTGAISQFGPGEVLNSILEPSATVNGRFMQTKYTLKNGTAVIGTAVDAVDGKVIVIPAMMVPQVTIEIPQADIAYEEPSDISAMPAGLLTGFTREQVLDLFAYLTSSGDKYSPIYQKK